MVERFEYICPDCDPGIHNVNLGRYVRYSDYTALEAKLVERVKEVSRLQQALVRYGDRTRMAWAPSDLQQTIDDALSALETTPPEPNVTEENPIRAWRIRKGEPIPQWLEATDGIDLKAADDLIVIEAEEGFDVYHSNPNSNQPMMIGLPHEEGGKATIVGAPTNLKVKWQVTTKMSALWVGDPEIIPIGEEVTILAVDWTDPDTRKACWIRWWPEIREYPIYRSCDLSDINRDGANLTAAQEQAPKVTEKNVETAARILAKCAWNRFNASDSNFLMMKYPEGLNQYIEENWQTYSDDARAVLSAAQEAGEL